MCKQYKDISFNNLFDLSLLTEKKSLEEVLKTLSFHSNDIGISKNHVDVRNNCAHASGRIYYDTQTKIEHFIDEEIYFVEKIQEKITIELKKFIEGFFENSWNKSFSILTIENMFKENYFSKEDLIEISKIKLNFLNNKSNNQKSVYQKILYLLLIYEIQQKTEIEENLFLNNLPLFMNGIIDTIVINSAEDEYTINTSELIEEYLIPIISSFYDEDRRKSEELLGYS